jgi:hypothetical protein
MEDDKKKLVIAGVLLAVALGAVGIFLSTGGGQAPGQEKVEYGKTPPPDSAAVPGTPGQQSGTSSETNSERL